jgi:DNA-binding NtrC family response regulator
MKARPNPQRRILLIDDEENFLNAAITSLEIAGMDNAVSCSDTRLMEGLLAREEYACILLDLSMPFRSGWDLLTEIVRDHPITPVIVITGADRVEVAVQCMKAGAFDYIVKPVDDTRLVTSVQNAIDYGEVRAENSLLKTRLFSPALHRPEVFARIITRNGSMHGIFQYVEAIGGTGLPILIIGETGVGKELIAHAVHDVSGRKGLFVPINAAGLDDGLFSDTLFGHTRGAFTGADKDHEGLVQRASQGTLFLDEIGDLSPESQVKLLRLLQEGEFYPLGSAKPATTDARFVFATCHDLLDRVRKGLFRQDLYYRLQSHSITIPPLRDRRDDIPMLVHHFVQHAAKLMDRRLPTVPEELIRRLQQYDFPGNVRELEGMIRDTLVRSSTDVLALNAFEVRFEHTSVPSPVRSYEQALDHVPTEEAPAHGSTLETETKRTSLKESERRLIMEAVRSANGNKTRAAAMLGISRQALCNRLRRMRSGK